MNYRNIPENDETPELLSVEDEKLRRMLGGLKRVDAPRNFEFAVKSKIARRQAETPQKQAFLPVLRLVLPLCLLILFGGFVVFNLFFSANVTDVPQVAEQSAPLPKIQITPESSPAAPVVSEPANSESKKPEVAAVTDQTRKTVHDIQVPAVKNPSSSQSFERNENDFAGTLESASKESRTVLPRGINPNQKVTQPDNPAGRNSFSATEILREIGIEAGANLQVVSVRHNSPAERAGVKTGDVVDAIDDQKIAPETTFVKPSGGKTLHLLRGGQKITAELGKP